MMKVVEQQDATRPLGEYAAEIKGGTVVVTDHGRPVTLDSRSMES